MSNSHIDIGTPARRRGRPPSFDRLAALDAATRLFWQYGYEGTSIAMLTEAMGATPPTLYAAFGSKEALYCEALAHYGRATGGETSDRLYANVEQFLRAAAVRFTRIGEPRGCMISTGSLRAAADQPAAVEATAARRAAAFDGFVERVKIAIAQGELPPDTNAQALARFYSAVAQGMSVQAIDGATAEDLNALVDLALAAWPK
jgi:TetR/AcrR family transcriptional regulator, copper-responsive repressor